MARRVVFDGHREGRRLVFRQRRPLIARAAWLLLTLPLGMGAGVGVWKLLGCTVGPTTRAGYATLTCLIMMWMLRLQLGGSRK